MATLSRAESKAMYSWWWDSHISPKNSRWLQENLTDMDNKVRTMIKLIEVDEDSFARRAEMYYKKRPELMKLVEEFYRAYRALAERYDNATGVIRQAHRTMAEAFPNQVPFLMTDDGPLNLTPNQTPVQASSGFLSLNGDGDFTDDSISVADQKAKKQLNFHEMEENKQDMKGNGNLNAHVVSESERWRQFEIDIQDLKEALAELEAEKEEKLSKLDFEVSRAKENSKGLNERATVAEVEVQSLKETLANVEAEKEASLLRCQQCLERISNLESGISQAEQDSKKLSDRACKAEDEAELLKDELNQLKAEKESLLTKYMEALEKTANLENRLLLAEDCAGRTSVRAEKEAETLRESITKLTTEKEAAIVKCEQCLEKKANLEHEVTLAREEAVRLRTEVQDGAAKLKDSKKQFRLLDRSNKALQSELDSLVKKQKELGRLWTSVQEERMRSEAAMKSLQNSHSEVQEKLGSVSAELQKKVQDLKDLQIQNQSLEDEVEKVKNENKDLNDLNLSSVVLIKDFQGEIFDLKEGKRRLEQELASHHDQRSSLQQEIYCLKEELSNLNQRHRDIMGQIESLGFPSESFCSSMKELQDENSRLIETCKKNNVEISSLGEKLDAMEKLVEKNELLENSLLDLQAELEGTRKKVKVLDESFHLLLGEKSVLGAEKAALMTQLQITTENLEKLSERNILFEKSLFDANIELEMLRMKSKNLEDSFCVFIDQNSVLATDKETLARQLGTTKKKISALEEERALTLQRVEELLVLLDVEKHDHAKSRELSQTRIHDLENQVRLLQETSYNTRKEFEKELDKAANAQFDIFILQNCIHDLNATIIKLLEINEELIFKVREGDEKEVVHLAEMECLREKVFTLQWAFEDLQKENCEVIEDKESLMKAFDALAEEKSNLEHECSCAVAEAIACDNLSSVLNNVIFDTTTQFLEWTKNVARLCHDNELLEENARILEQKLDEVLAAHVELEASLKKSENELEEVKSVNDELKVEIANGKDLLSLKEMELLEAMARKINQENRTSKLSESYAEQLKECERLREVVKHLDSQVSKMNEEHEKTDVSVTILSSELQNGKDEVKLWETVAGTFFTELQSSSLREAIIKEKYSELVKACEILEDESSSKCMDVVQLRERVGVLEGENAHLKDQLAVGYSAILSLRDSLASIEKHTIWQKELCKTDKEDKEDMKQCQNLNDDEVAGAQSNKIFVLQEVQDRVQAVEKAIIDLKHHAEEQYSTVRSELDLAMRQIELLKSQSGSRRRSGGLSVRLASRQDCNLKSNSAYGYELQKSSSSISERANDHLMRDIMLDQVSDWSSHGKNRKVNGSDDRILELWETTNQGEGIDLTVGKFSHIKAVKESKNDRPSLESTVDKELCVDDQLDISNKICEIRLDNYKRKTLDRLTSDVQKLSNLKITVQDLKEKLEMTEKFSSDGVESDGIKDQLVGSEETISKLYDYSEKLIKKIQNSSLASTSSSFDGSVTADSMDGGGSARRRRYSEHARRISEKIGRLQLEVQKVQFLLMKIDNNKASKSGAEIMENDSQTLLRDYLYSGTGVSKTARKKKKSQFCGCMQNPGTKGD